MSEPNRDPRVQFRAPPALVEWLDDAAEQTGVSRSELLRRSIHFMRDAQPGDLIEQIEREQELEQEIADIIEDNQTLRKIVPSRWRSHVRDLFTQDLKNDTTPNDLRVLASGYRRQAAKYEELATEIPEAPEADLVGVVDEELRHAIEAADLSNWYEGVENPHETRLSGVEEGRQEREAAVRIVQQVVDVHEHLAAAFKSTDEVPPVRVSNIPAQAESLLPDDVTREDVADLATELVRAGVTAEQVPDVLPTVDPALEPEEIVADVESDGGDPEIEAATIRKGGVPVDAYDQDDEQPDADGGDPLTAEASELTQRQLASLPAADGGRDPRSVPGTVEDSETDMNPATDENDDSTDSDDPTDADDLLDRLTGATAGGEADE